MVATTIKVRHEDKVAFDRLQAQLTLALGQKVDQQRLFGEVLRLARENRDRLFPRDAGPRLTAAERKRIRSLPTDYGVVINDIDEAVYGR